MSSHGSHYSLRRTSEREISCHGATPRRNPPQKDTKDTKERQGELSVDIGAAPQRGTSRTKKHRKRVPEDISEILFRRFFVREGGRHRRPPALPVCDLCVLCVLCDSVSSFGRQGLGI